MILHQAYARHIDTTDMKHLLLKLYVALDDGPRVVIGVDLLHRVHAKIVTLQGITDAIHATARYFKVYSVAHL
jgi:hypothetical protein